MAAGRASIPGALIRCSQRRSHGGPVGTRVNSVVANIWTLSLAGFPLRSWVAGLLVVLWLPSEFRYSRQAGKGPPTDRRSSEVMLVALLLNLVVVVACLRSGFGRIATAGWPEPLGAALAAVGIGLRYWAIASLGRFFTSAVVLQDDHALVERGPFKWLRHPGYAGVLAFGTGLILMFRSASGALIYLLGHGLAICYRIAVEEKALLTRLGAPYEIYRQRTWRLLPFVY